MEAGPDYSAIQSSLRPRSRRLTELQVIEQLCPHIQADDPNWPTPWSFEDLRKLLDRLPEDAWFVCALTAVEMRISAWWNWAPPAGVDWRMHERFRRNVAALMPWVENPTRGNWLVLADWTARGRGMLHYYEATLARLPAWVNHDRYVHALAEYTAPAGGHWADFEGLHQQVTRQQAIDDATSNERYAGNAAVGVIRALTMIGALAAAEHDFVEMGVRVSVEPPAPTILAVAPSARNALDRVWALTAIGGISYEDRNFIEAWWLRCRCRLAFDNPTSITLAGRSWL